MARRTQLAHGGTPLSRPMPSWRRATRLGPMLLEHLWLALAVGVSLVSVARLLTIVTGRLDYPYDLEWMEGGMVAHALRVRHGQPLYVAPGLDHVPFIYTPLFYALGALLMPVLGEGPIALRMVAVAGMLTTLAAMAFVVWRCTGSRVGALLSASCFAATYPLSGGWMDIARADTTLLATQLLAACAVLRPGRAAPITAAAFVLLAFLAKQYGVLAAVPIAAYLWGARGFRSALWFGLSTAALLAAVVMALDWQSDGYFRFWVFEVPAAHPGRRHGALALLHRAVLEPMPLATAVGVGGLFALAGGPVEGPTTEAARTREWRARALLLLSLVAVWTVQAFASYEHSGSYLNCLMPLHLAVSLLVGIALARATPQIRPVALCLLAAQMALWNALPGRWIPTAADRRAHGDMQALLARCDGRALFGFRGVFGAPGDNATLAHQMALVDLAKARQPALMQTLRAAADAHFAALPYDVVLLDNHDYVLMPELRRHYRLVRSEPRGKGAGWTVTGASMKPRLTFVPRRTPLAPDGTPRRSCL